MKTNLLQAKKIFDVLVKYCGCSPGHGEVFVSYLLTNEQGEYRFQGNLGFGGKLYFDDVHCHVNCYDEDQTPERLDAIQLAHEEISKILEQ